MGYLGEILEFMVRHFWRICGVFLAIFAVVAYTLFSTESYTAQTSLLFKLGRDYVYVPEATEDGARAPDLGDLQLVVNAEMQILNSDRLKRELLDRLGVSAIFPGMPEGPEAQRDALDALNQAIDIGVVTGSYVVQLAVTHPDPEMAASIARALVDLYLSRRDEIFGAGEENYLRDQLAGSEAEVEALEAALADRTGGSDLLTYETELQALTSEQATLRQELVALDAEIAALRERETLIVAELGEVEPMSVDLQEYQRNPILGTTEARRLELEAERRSIAEGLGDKHPSVLALERQIAALREMAEEQPAEVRSLQRTAANPLHRQARQEHLDVRLRLAELSAKRDFIVERMTENADRLAGYAARAGEIELLQKKLASQLEQVARFYTRLRDREAQGGHGALNNIRVIEEATVPLKPSGLPKKIKLAMSLLIAGASTLGLVLAAFFGGRKIRSAASAERVLGVPVLGEIESRPPAQRAAELVAS